MSDTPETGPGADLKTTREDMEVSTREVADALNLPVNVIEALEADDYERLPPTVFTRGYLRSYARLLELSPESLLARYPEVTEETDAITGELPVANAPVGTPTRTLGIAAVAGAVLIALLVWLLGDNEPAEPENAVAAETVTADSAAAEEQAAMQTPGQTLPDPTRTDDLPEAEPSTVDSSVQSVPASADDPVEPPATGERLVATPDEPVSSRASAPDPAVADAGQPSAPESIPESMPDSSGDADEASSSAAVSTSETSAVPGVRTRRITEFGDDQLTFVFSEDCWLEVKSVDGDNLYSDLNRTGQTLILTGRAPFRILLGYAPGVSLSFNDEPVPLARYSRNNVANLVLGE